MRAFPKNNSHVDEYERKDPDRAVYRTDWGTLEFGGQRMTGLKLRLVRMAWHPGGIV